MTLLTTMMERPLDPGYAAAAARREAAGLPPSTSLRSRGLGVAALAIGLVVGVSASNLTAADDAGSHGRQQLIGQIETRRAEADDLRAQAAALEAEVAAAEADLLGDDGTAERARALAVSAGAVPLEGPGVVLTLDDAPGGDDGAGTDDAADGRVLAKDLQYVVNALWRSGAEAVSVNDKRLTSLSAIRFAGSAIIVDYRPLTRPYVVTALGDPESFPAEFADGPGGSYLSTLRSTFGIRVDSEVSRSLRVPAAVGLSVRNAETGDTGTSTATSPPTAAPGASAPEPTAKDDSP